MFTVTANNLYYIQSYQNRITKQLRRLGGSYDWNRVAFTMDEVSLFTLLVYIFPTVYIAAVQSCSGDILPIA